jgi:hypothetical protein
MPADDLISRAHVSAGESPAGVPRLSPTLSLTLGLVAVLLSGCAVPLYMRGQRSPDPTHVLARKLVVEKTAPLDLIAEDGTRCETTKRRFERTRIGSKVWCLWTGDPERGVR